MDDRIRTLVERVWRYHQLDHEISEADAILVLCSHDPVVAERGAQLYLEGWAPLLILSGGFGSITRRLWNEPEARIFARIAVDLGVPPRDIVVEEESSNTGENVLFTRRLLEQKGIDPRRFIVVQKPYMERRSFATFRKVWPEKDLIVTSPKVTLADYLSRYANSALSEDEVISIMVGDLQRIRIYPEKGYQIPQEIPGEIWSAFEELVAAGYDRHLIPTE